MIPCSTPASSTVPDFEMPSPYMTSNSASRNGGASLFFTTLTLVRTPTDSVPILIASCRRMSSRTEA